MDIKIYSLILNDTNQQVIIENNKILLWNSLVNAAEYHEITNEVRETFRLITVNEEEEEDMSLNLEEIPPNSPSSPEVPATIEDRGSHKFTWTHQSTLLLLDEYKGRIAKFRDPKIKKKVLWDEISQAMKTKSYFVDADAIDRKIRNMKNTFRTICDNNNKRKTTGKGRIQWEYYNQFMEIFEEDKTVNLPSTILSSTKISEELSIGTSTLASTSDISLSSSLSLTCTSPVDANERNSPNSIKDIQGSTPTSKGINSKRLDKFRKRQLEIEEEKLKELKRLRQSIEESNTLQSKKLELFKQLLQNKDK